MKSMRNKEADLHQIIEIYREERTLGEFHCQNESDGTLRLRAVFSLYGQRNTCTCGYDRKMKRIQSNCDCAWYKDYRECPHLYLAEEYLQAHKAEYAQTGALTYVDPFHRQLEEESENYEARRADRQLREQAQKSRDMLEQFRSRYEMGIMQDITQTHYQLEPRLHMENEPAVSFRVYADSEYKYIIRSIPEFINAINDHKDVSYGKNLHFVHDEHAFDAFAQKQIRFMRKYLKHTENLVYVIDTDVKTIKLNGSALDDFYELYENRDVSFALTDKENAITIDAMRQKDYDIFHLVDRPACYFGEKHLYYPLKQGNDITIIRRPLDEQGVCLAFIKRLYEADIVVDHHDYPMLYKYVLATLMQYADVNLPKRMDQNSMERTELYGDIDETGRIYFYLYHYDGDHKRYHGFDERLLLSYEQDVCEAYLRRYGTMEEGDPYHIYMDESADSTLEFLSEGLVHLQHYCDIYVSEKLKRLGKTQRYRIHVGVHYHGDLLSLDVSSPQIPQEELSEVLEAYQRKKKFYRLKNGRLLSLVSSELAELSDLIEHIHVKLKDIHNGRVIVSSYRMFTIARYAASLTHIDMVQDAEFQSYVNDFHKQDDDLFGDERFAILRDYQKEGVKWLCDLRRYGFHGILADDMGLGKTLQVIAYLEAVKRTHPSLVVCPASLVYNWEDEVKKFAQGLKALSVCGNRLERVTMLSHYEEYDLLITSYDYVRRDVDLYEHMRFDTLILDEAQYIKNQKTKNAVAVKQIPALHRLAMSGTPMENTLAELWSIFDFLMPDYLYHYQEFQRKFEIDIVKNNDEEKKQELKRLISPFILRRTKAEVLKELPDKIETVRLIPFRQEEESLYLRNLALVNQRLQTLEDTWEENQLQVLAQLTRLRQLCCEPRLLYETIHDASSKLCDCLELMEQLRRNRRKVLVFSSFVSLLHMLEAELKRKGISYVMLTGRTSKEERKKRIDQFQNEDISAFLISLKAGGTGINLTAAEAVIHLDPWWNTSSQNQATDRAYRMGQTKNVQVYRLIMKDSIEEKIMKLQHQKQALANDFLEGSSAMLSFMSREEVMELVSEQQKAKNMER